MSCLPGRRAARTMYPAEFVTPGELRTGLGGPQGSCTQVARATPSLLREAKAERLATVCKAFVVMVVRDGIKPDDAHEALLAVEEYREEIAPYLEGAELQG